MTKLNIDFLKSFNDKAKGLLGEAKPRPIYFKTRFGIHTFGMNFPIDVIILDRNNKVVTIKENLKPNRIFVWNPKFYQVVELSKGFIKKYNIKLGERLVINFL